MKHGMNQIRIRLSAFAEPTAGFYVFEKEERRRSLRRRAIDPYSDWGVRLDAPCEN